jgi:hypothetical protein
MSPQIVDQTTLSDKSIWIIDDDIPIQSADFNNDAMLEGSCPIDRGALLSLLLKEDDWTDKAVLDLCKELSEDTCDIKAFLLPTGAVEYLQKGAKAPDVMIFDMNYRNIKEKKTVLEYLETILKTCISVIQIYTKEALEEFAPDLEPLARKYWNRLQPPRLKDDTHADQLAEAISQKLSSSLSAQLATNIRRLSSIAIENVLVRIDDLPLDVAVNLLAGDDEEILEENLKDEELIELLSAKIGDFMKSSKELADTMSEYARKAEVPAEKEKLFVDEAVQLFATTVRTHIQYDKWLYGVVKSARQTAQANALDADSLRTIIQEFFAFRLYDHPGDDIVRTGDIISLSPIRKTDNTPAYLFVVITPPCDLDRFWKSTRGILTLAKMHPLTTDLGIRLWKDYGNNKPGRIHSITSTENPFVLPSVPISETGRVDYSLFLYEIENKEYDGRSLWKEEDGISKSKRFSRPLTYSELKKISRNVKRYCRISEPFLTGLLGELKDQLFRTGVPNFPKNEKDRLSELF